MASRRNGEKQGPRLVGPGKSICDTAVDFVFRGDRSLVVTIAALPLRGEYISATPGHPMGGWGMVVMSAAPKYMPP